MIFREYERALGGFPEVRIAAVADTDSDRRAAAAVGGRVIRDSFLDLLNLDLDAILILTRNADHALMAQAALERGCATLCEKPLALNAETAGQLLMLAGRRHTVLHPAMHCRHRPEASFLRERLRGDIVWFDMTYREYWLDAEPWYFDPFLAGGGALVDLGINQLDWIMEFIPALKVEEACFSMCGKDVDVESRLVLSHTTGGGIVDFGWNTHPPKKRTLIRSSFGQTFLIDHLMHSVVLDGQLHGPWPNLEYACVVREFLVRRERAPTWAKERVPDVLRLLRSAYAKAGLPFLRP
jgi:predicted dehydrogenase